MKGDFAIRVGRTGQDVARCPDNKLLFDNRWPTLKIFMQGSIGIVDSGSTGYSTLATHNLGYYPAFIYFLEDASGRYFGSINEIECTTTDIRFYHQGNARGAITIYFMVFLLDLEVAIDASNVRLALTDSQGQDKHTAFEVARYGKNVANAQPEDYAASGKYISLIIHKLVNGSKTVGDFTVAHGLGYEPMTWCYGKGAEISQVGYRNLSALGSDHELYADNTNVHISDGYAYTYALIIFKEPMS